MLRLKNIYIFITFRIIVKNTNCVFFSLYLLRFCAGNWTRDLLPDRALHTPVLLLLCGHSGLPSGHTGRSHANLEHSTPAWWLPGSSSYNHQSLARVTFSPTPQQRLRGVSMLKLCERTWGDYFLQHNCFSPNTNYDSQEKKRGFLWLHKHVPATVHGFFYSLELFCCFEHRSQIFN